MITGRTYGAVSQNELRARCQGMSSPRGRFVQFIDPNDVLLPSYVSRSVDLLASQPEGRVRAGARGCGAAIR